MFGLDDWDNWWRDVMRYGIVCVVVSDKNDVWVSGFNEFDGVKWWFCWLGYNGRLEV
ncbi:hypothetical protein [Candidatus Hodgkinia cicadicola]|uniref:hypothetical protein n=1 Tax=Candidatus Hodgkinia cicadicola TaxID=573658 RepID=UPI001788BEF3